MVEKARDADGDEVPTHDPDIPENGGSDRREFREPTTRRMRYGARLAFTGGILFLLGGGSASTSFLLSLVQDAPQGLEPIEPVQAALAALLPLLATLGGLTILIGAWLIREGKRAGALLVDAGTGAGLLGFAVQAWATLVSEGSFFRFVGSAFTGIAGLGLLLILVARTMVLPWGWARQVRAWWRARHARRDAEA